MIPFLDGMYVEFYGINSVQYVKKEPSKLMTSEAVIGF